MTESSLSLHKRHEDRISQLPDEILISIISRLTLREATATSLLSSCWRYLHTYITRLDFPPIISSTDPHINHLRKGAHIDMVNNVLNSHRGSHIKELKAEMGYMGNSTSFKKCFEFALTKKAEIIYMDMNLCDFGALSRTILLHGLKYVKELSLSNIFMTDQDFDLLVTNCLALESLSIDFLVNKLKNVSIVGHSKLKHLGLAYVLEDGSFEIRDLINLVSLSCYGLSANCLVQLSNIPKLIELDYEDFDDTLSHAEFFAKLPSCIRDQLQSLYLSTGNCDIFECEESLFVKMSVELVNVKDLVLVIEMIDRPCCYFLLCSLFYLIEACHSLENLIIKFRWRLPCIEEFKEMDEGTEFSWPKLSLKSLKAIEIGGYFGSRSELELALHIVSNARALEKLSVVPCDLNDTVREEASACARRDFQHIRSVNVNIF